MAKKMNIRTSVIRLAFVPIFIVVLTGCAKKAQLTKSGFLGNYTDLREDEKFKGLYLYKAPDIDISERYSAIIIDPVEFQFDTEDGTSPMKQEDQQKLSDYFLERLEEGLLENYAIVDVPGDHVLRLRSAVTDVAANKIYLNLHWSTTLIGGGVGGASIEVELVDSLTHKRILSFIDARKGRRLNYTKGLTKWGHTKEVLGIWANIIVDHLTKLQN